METLVEKLFESKCTDIVLVSKGDQKEAVQCMS